MDFMIDDYGIIYHLCADLRKSRSWAASVAKLQYQKMILIMEKMTFIDNFSLVENQDAHFSSFLKN